jgi:hypothetical protein
VAQRHQTGDDDAAPRRPERKQLAVGIAIAGAVCLIVAAFSRSWLENPRAGNVRGLSGEVRLGPLGFEACAGAACQTLSNAELVDAIAASYPLDKAKYTSRAFSPTGWITLVTCLCGALGLLAAAALALANRRPELPISPASIALLAIMAAMVAGCVFVATKPGPPGMVGVSWGFWIFGGGTVLGIAGAQLLARQIRPVDPDLLADAMDPDEFPS